ncbi:MAG: hypothetical protein AB1428_13130 [Bacteroidota bacterium]
MDMKQLLDILQWVPVPIVIVVFGGTYAARRIITQPVAPGEKPQKAPRWFVLMPFGLAFAFAFLYYFNFTDPEELRALPPYLRIVRPLYQGVFSGFASILVWEVGWKRWLRKQKNGAGDPPTIPPGT